MVRGKIKKARLGFNNTFIFISYAIQRESVHIILLEYNYLKYKQFRYSITLFTVFVLLSKYLYIAFVCMYVVKKFVSTIVHLGAEH